MFDKVYIISPYAASGGPEGLHMLCHAINEQGGDAYMVYYGGFPREDGSQGIHFGLAMSEPPHPDFKEYNLQIAETVNQPDSIENSSKTAIVIPEHFDTYQGFSLAPLAQRFIWWLSTKTAIHVGYQPSDSAIHLCDCHAACELLASHGMHRYFILQYYVAERFLEFPIPKKSNIVTYNPSRFTPELQLFIEANPDIHFVPVGAPVGSDKWVDREHVARILSTSKVYLDFGDFRGRENVPKEACVLMNCVIANRRGAARFFADVPLPDKYKCSEPKQVRDLILDCFENYDERVHDFDLTRNILRNQKPVFFGQVKQLFL